MILTLSLSLSLSLFGPAAAGYASGCWTALLLQDLIQRLLNVEYNPHYICQLLQNMGFTFQKAKFVSDHLDDVSRQLWKNKTWPEILRLAQEKNALILFGDEASFAQWGSLSYTWAPLTSQRSFPPIHQTLTRSNYYGRK